MDSDDDNGMWDFETCESMVGDWWDGLRESNHRRLESRAAGEPEPYAALSAPVVQVVFTAAHALHQPTTVRYLALEMFDRFVRLLFAQLRDYTRAGAGRDVSRSRQWLRVLARTRSQTALRVMSCLQLASKLHRSTQALSPASVQSFLRQMGQPFSRHSIMASERRVLKTIHFQFGVPACTYLQHLVGCLQQLAPCPDPSQLYSTALAVLDLSFLSHHQVFPSALTAGPWHRRSIPTAAGCDQVKLSAAVLVCALFVLSDYQDGTSLALHRLTDLPMSEVEELARTILDVTGIVPASSGT
ncbi:cyclin N-terminal domain-containing protein 1-like isoform X2 [Bacillus rossius redtenbacheri]|uniref:cyclin N-terminal domain-containing protein 1-like isoform X2 n=1 Tax=Bacillus rossius redtenbacheri TaxID=93214 RepID=UPI002FDE6B38